VLLRLDLRPRREAHAEQLGAHALAELGLGEQQEVVVGASQDAKRGDHARLRRQQQRLAARPCGERLDVVREHPLEVVRRVRACDADERSGPGRMERHPG
jgi:hypothetical protein